MAVQATKYHDQVAHDLLVKFPVGNKHLDVNVTVAWRLESPGDPGRITGPPEDCWPPESPEISIGDVADISFCDESVTLEDVNLDECHPAFVGNIEAAVLEAYDPQAFESDAESDRYEDDE